MNQSTKSSADLVEAIYQAAGRRGGFARPTQANQPEIHIPPGRAETALHGDTVEVAVSRRRGDEQAQGQVVRVTRRAHKQLLGRLVYTGKRAVVFPKSKRIDRIVELRGKVNPAEYPDGSWVLVEVRQWSPSPEVALGGRLLELVGRDGDKGLPVLLLVREGGISPDFPAEVEAEARALTSRATTGVTVSGSASTSGTAPGGTVAFDAQTLAGRRDYRASRTFTIDPLRAKDFDDAVSFEGRRGQGWRVAVHIADVAHYVRPGTLIDAEAYERGTSIYPVDRVIPMLPEALSNELCSLRPNEDRLTMSVEMTIGPAGEVGEVVLSNSVIHSVRRFYYEEVQGLFELADGKPPEAIRFPRPVIDPALLGDIMQVRAAGQALAAMRQRRGSLDLDLPETEILFDAQGKVSDLRRAERFEAHRLIEELMIAANEAVARELARNELPLLYRVHQEPAPDRLIQVAPVLARLGINMSVDEAGARATLQRALDRARQHPAGSVVQKWVLRAMMRARYQPENIGHYGLASACYAHFTSPIRRYPDLLVHRAVKALVADLAEGGDTHRAAWHSEAGGQAEAWGRHTSGREERAQHIEWDAESILALDFMQRFMGDIFEGHIAGVTGMGFYVELRDYPVEGLVRIATLDDDYYDFDDDYHMWRGRRSGRVWALGDAVTVMIERIDVLAGQMDLQLVQPSGGTDNGRRGRGGKSGSPRGKQGGPARGGKGSGSRFIAPRGGGRGRGRR